MDTSFSAGLHAMLPLREKRKYNLQEKILFLREQKILYLVRKEHSKWNFFILKFTWKHYEVESYADEFMLSRSE